MYGDVRRHRRGGLAQALALPCRPVLLRSGRDVRFRVRRWLRNDSLRNRWLRSCGGSTCTRRSGDDGTDGEGARNGHRNP